MLGVSYKYKVMKILSDSLRISKKVLEHELFKNIGYHTHDTPPVKEEGRPSHKSKASKVPARITFDLHRHLSTQEKRHDILECQMKEVRDILKYYSNNKIKRIELIHGGNEYSTLRVKIWETLSKDYKNIATWRHPANNPGTTEIDFT